MQLKGKKDDKLTARAVAIDEKEVALRRKIMIWSSIQSIYMPCVDTLRPATRQARQEERAADDDDESEVLSSVDMELYLPGGTAFASTLPAQCEVTREVSKASA